MSVKIHAMTNIVLIGMPGSGKSSAGRKISETLFMPFIDTDEIIENRLEMNIPCIFKQYGESYFRDMESDAARRAAATPGVVISTGGGIITRAENMAILKSAGMVVYLRCEAEQLFKRTEKDKTRPLLHVPDRLLKIKELSEVRNPLYKNYSDFTVDTDNLSVNEISEMICNEYRRHKRTEH